MTGIRRKKIRKENKEFLILNRRRKQEQDKAADKFFFELTGKPVRHNPKS